MFQSWFSRNRKYRSTRLRTNSPTAQVMYTFYNLMLCEQCLRLKHVKFSWSCKRHLSILYNVREFRQLVLRKMILFQPNATQPTINSSEVLSNAKNFGSSAPYNKISLWKTRRRDKFTYDWKYRLIDWFVECSSHNYMSCLLAIILTALFTTMSNNTSNTSYLVIFSVTSEGFIYNAIQGKLLNILSYWILLGYF